MKVIVIEVFYYGIKYKIEKIFNKEYRSLLKKRYKYGKKILISDQEANNTIYDAIINGTPFLAARYGANEMAIMRKSIEITVGIKKDFDYEIRKQFSECAGFFPASSEFLKKFADMMMSFTKNVDLFGAWHLPLEEYFISHYNGTHETAKVTALSALEPWDMKKPWTMALEGKNVLVIHPFVKTIEEQYKHRKEIFPNGTLPMFNLKLIKAVQTLGGEKDERFNTWFEALDYMYEETKKIKFDVAIVGCGAYGFPLAAKIKEDCKVVIHLGGATQLLFGIRGKRWDEMSCFKDIFNNAWVYPMQEDRIQNISKVENGCYW